MKVNFFDKVNDQLLKFAVIMCEYRGKWVFCKHKDRDTYEIPGGHRDKGESILEAAKRELFEETGATRYHIRPVCAYSVKDHEETYGMLYYSQIEEFSELPPFEIKSTQLFDHMPENLTYPLIQPHLFYRTLKAVKCSSFTCVL